MATKVVVMLLFAACVSALPERHRPPPIGSDPSSLPPQHKPNIPLIGSDPKTWSPQNRPNIPLIGSDPSSLPPQSRPAGVRNTRSAARDYQVVGPGGIHNPDIPLIGSDPSSLPPQHRPDQSDESSEDSTHGKLYGPGGIRRHPPNKRSADATREYQVVGPGGIHNPDGYKQVGPGGTQQHHQIVGPGGIHKPGIPLIGSDPSSLPPQHRPDQSDESSEDSTHGKLYGPGGIRRHPPNKRSADATREYQVVGPGGIHNPDGYKQVGPGGTQQPHKIVGPGGIHNPDGYKKVGPGGTQQHRQIVGPGGIQRQGSGYDSSSSEEHDGSFVSGVY